MGTIAEVALIQGMSISDVVAGMNAAGIEATVLATAISNGAAKAAENGATFADADGNLIAVEDVGTLVLAAITAELGNTAAGTTPTAGLTPIITIPTVSSPPPHQKNHQPPKVRTHKNLEKQREQIKARVNNIEEC